jgi:hypothetical protein
LVSFWAVDNVYATQNGGDYDFVVEKKGAEPSFRNYAWPTEQRFWVGFTSLRD